MTTNIQAFRPVDSTVSLQSTDSSQRVNFPALSGQEGNLRLWNSGSEEAFIELGDVTVTATTSSMPIPPGVIEVISVGGADDYLAAICNTGQTTQIYVTPGFGV